MNNQLHSSSQKEGITKTDDVNMDKRVLQAVKQGVIQSSISIKKVSYSAKFTNVF